VVTVPDASGGLIRAGIGPSEFGWLHRMWQDKPAAWLVRWPLLGHGPPAWPLLEPVPLPAGGPSRGSG
jgi:hypothetical protein